MRARKRSSKTPAAASASVYPKCLRSSWNVEAPLPSQHEILPEIRQLQPSKYCPEGQDSGVAAPRDANKYPAGFAECRNRRSLNVAYRAVTSVRKAFSRRSGPWGTCRRFRQGRTPGYSLASAKRQPALLVQPGRHRTGDISHRQSRPRCVKA
jgi:hypothetical protein